jgi:membrane associated rhomboid family serine protease
MKKPFSTQHKSVVEILIVVLIFCFLVNSIISVFSSSINNSIFENLYFSTKSISNFLFWTPLTYSFFHDGPFHLIFNLLGLYFIGRAVEFDIGKTNFIYLLCIGSAIGAFFWLTFNSSGQFLLGSSSMVMACLSMYCLKQPDNPITLLLFFVLPCKVKPRWILIGVLSIELYGFLFNEISSSSDIAHSAHLGGLLAGSLVFYLLRQGKNFPSFVFDVSKSKFPSKKTWPSTVDNSDFKINLSSTSELQKEVDRILDKINESGFGSLTSKEKITLDKAKSLLRN